MTNAEFVAWSEAHDAAGKRDAMGQPFTAWLLARYHPDGRAIRDARGHQVFETQAEFKARQACTAPAAAIGQTLELFP